MARKRKTFLEVEIIDMAQGDGAIGRKQDGEIVLVEKAVPGDVVHVHTLRKKKGMWLTTPFEFITLSDKRVDPFCSHFGQCGGCKWQHVDYAQQLQIKQKKIEDNLVRIGKFVDPQILPIIGSDEQQYYRNKLEFSFSNSRWLSDQEIKSGDPIDRSRALGFHPPKFYDKVVDINHCHLQPDPSNGIRNFIREFAVEQDYSYYDVKAHQGFLRTLMIRQGKYTGQLMVNFSFGEDNPTDIDLLLQTVATKFPQITSLNYCINTKWNDSTFDLTFIPFLDAEFIEEEIGDKRYRIGPKSFFQTNSSQAVKMFDIVKSWADLQAGETVYDLYCGAGSIGLYIVDDSHTLVGIEEVEEAIEQAKINQKLNGITHAHFHTGDVRLLLDEAFMSSHPQPDLIILDPPRAGLHADVITSLLAIGSPRIIYVSCNPATQARDLQLLSTRYNTTLHQPLDLFPHTHHMENIARLELK